jgi:aspartyl-tRNA(Asn)/glutamyl-tRNA(Gln) amidotransferase subunit B
VEDMERAVSEVLNKNKDAVEDYKRGKKEALNFLVGQVMKKTKGRATPQEVHEMLRNKMG